MLEEHSNKTIVAIALAMLAILSFQLGSNPGYSEEMDIFGVEKIYSITAGGNEWHVNMDDPMSDLQNIGNVHFSQNSIVFLTPMQDKATPQILFS